MDGGTEASLLDIVALLGAAVIAVPIFKRLGLGSVLGYLAAGIAIGPFGFGLFHDPGAVLHVAELGVVMLLFIIGLELKPSRLWSLRRDIFGLGAAQVVACTALIFLAAWAAGLTAAAAFVAALGLAQSSTAIVMQMLEERGEVATPWGQKIFAVLLFQDLAIVPALTAVSLLASGQVAVDRPPAIARIAIAAAAVLTVVAAGRYLLNPVFRLLASVRAREIMTAAALLVVLGAASVMQLGGLSMAMGAFLAGVLLSESSYRHELEADIEPFRGLLLGLFFLGVGMSIDLALVAAKWPIIVVAVFAFMAIKAGAIYVVASRRSDLAERIRLALLLAEGGEFAFVLYATATGFGVVDGETGAVLTAIVGVSMALTPLAAFLVRQLIPTDEQSLDGVDAADGLSGRALIIGFGRFGQVVSQPLLARGIDTAIIDSSPEMIRNAARFGAKIYYGDGRRLDVLRAAGAGTAQIIAVCVDDTEAADKIVEIVKTEFPVAKLLVRAYDRGHTLKLVAAGVDYEIRETLESALAFGKAALRSLGFSEEEATETAADVRRRDQQRLALQISEGKISAGRDLAFRPTPAPLVVPRREAKALSPETAELAGKKAPEAIGPPDSRTGP
ncbi:MAG: monovalent cation:proton antiporter-2 (CPA2) family protein [Bauldia sp.]